MFDLYYVYVLFLFVLLFVSLSQFPHTLFPSFWYSGAYALELAYATRTRGPLAGVWGSPPLLSSRTMYLCIACILCKTFALLHRPNILY